MSDTLTLPVVVGGRRLEPGRDAHVFEFENARVELARPSLEEVQDATRNGAFEALRALSIDDVAIFFDEVRQAWSDRANPWRRLAIEWSARITGYARTMIEWDADFLAHSLIRQKQYDTLETDLGDPTLLDDWSRSKATLLRCWPQGLITHVMVGNVPMASLFTLWRSLVTKNLTVTKVPRRDPVSALCFANCIVDAGPDHPVARALTAMYWEPESELEDWLIATSNVVSVWGRSPAVESIKRRVPCGTDLIEFGPKRSFVLVLDGVRDWDVVGMRVANDVVMYDQEGCFSPQEAFVVGDPDKLADSVSAWLERAARAIPRRDIGIDGHAHVMRTRMEALGEGWRVVAPDTSDWTVVVTDGLARLPEHPLSRLLYIHPVDGIDEVLETMDRNVQTVAVEPWERVREVADALTARGATRIVSPGHMGGLRPGFVHDGFHPMRRMVRWVTIERGYEQKYRFVTQSEADDVARMRAMLGG